MSMKMLLVTALAGVLLSTSVAAPAEARRRDQDEAYEATRSGQIRSLREIESRVVPRMGGASYLGPEFDSGSATYRLKFMRAGSVIWVDVDGRTGAIIGRSGN
jgi:uncharacterized membrane protein YkoI